MSQTVTSGIVGGLHRSNVGIEQYENFADAAIYPGSSGGAIVNLQGNLVGICTAFSGSKNNTPGMGFAIPVNMARNIADQIIEFGEIRRGSIGITTEDLKRGVPRDGKLSASQSGAVISKVDPGSPAARTGLKPGDVVVRLGDRTVVGSAFLRNTRQGRARAYRSVPGPRGSVAPRIPIRLSSVPLEWPSCASVRWQSSRYCGTESH